MITYSIKPSDVGKFAIVAFGRAWLVQDFMGRIFPGDVGKRVYLSSGVLQVESDEQLAKRRERERARQ